MAELRTVPLSSSLPNPAPRSPVPLPMLEGCLFEILGFLFEGLLECLCDACFCGLWEGRAGLDRKPRREELP